MHHQANQDAFVQILASVDQPSDLRRLKAKRKLELLPGRLILFTCQDFFIFLRFLTSHFLYNGSSAIPFGLSGTKEEKSLPGFSVLLDAKKDPRLLARALEVPYKYKNLRC
jgi:hypothetical protein